MFMKKAGDVDDASLFRFLQQWQQQFREQEWTCTEMSIISPICR